ncbi:metal ABC transporter ATP-binding protein [Phormidium pseudopriestleyi FRX01]|uniref:Metal ABC transporter ATP-binding protein n=1 Tax=Phormidium pseudopriestleyi FRX01 TaxID=1759528 RepID=A0ABS3FSS3_9CYAN|nr:metal ABC transporter ATP-binding protein [Phormidium pseudopriestleyi]MBO0350176.1 metal ABC transporter ATP-binding protein [Phormidium pseudopriestleyi FRX01]
MLEVENLAVSYRNIRALEGVSFAIAPGQLVGLMGPNGAGKSTLIKAMLGLIPATSGRVQFRSQPLRQQLSRVAYIPQRSQIDWHYPISVWNVVMMGRTAQTGWFRDPSRQSRSIVQSVIERVGLSDYCQTQIGELSGGQQQRVFLARALAQEADLLLFDEPFTGVDQPTEEIMFTVFYEQKNQGKTLLAIGHDLGKSVGNYDQLILLNKQIVAQGSPREVLTQDNLHQAYQTPLAFVSA